MYVKSVHDMKGKYILFVQKYHIIVYMYHCIKI